MRLAVAVVALLAAAAAAPAPRARAATGNVVDDGGFEAPLSGSQTTWVAGDTFGPWTVGSGDVQQIGDFWDPAAGAQSLDLNGDVRGSIRQDVATVPGATYALRFAMAGNPDQQGVKQIAVYWDGQLVDTPQFDSTGHMRYGTMGWTTHSYSVQATAATTRLQFDSLAPASAYGAALDEVAAVGELPGAPPPPPPAPPPATATENVIYGTVRGRVVAGIAGAQTVNPWVATFNDLLAGQPSNYSARIDWGDGSTSAGTIARAAHPHTCDYLGATPDGGCFVVATAGHRFRSAGTRPFTVSVREYGGPPISGQAIAEIVPHSFTAYRRQPARFVAPAVGPMTFTAGGQIYGCTAEALSGTSIVVTAKHCSTDLGHDADNDDFRFSPAELGDCWANGRRPLSQCSGSVAEPHGIFCASRGDVFRDPRPGQGSAFIVMRPCGSFESLGHATKGGIPVTFNPARGRSWRAYGYGVYAAAWRLTECGPLRDESAARAPGDTSELDGPLFGAPCGLGSGVSGGPWVDDGALAGVWGVGAVNELLFGPPPNGCGAGVTCRLPDGRPNEGPSTYASGTYLGDTAMALYIRAVLATRTTYPVLSSAALTSSVFAVGPPAGARVAAARAHRGTVLRFELNHAARVVIVVQRRGRRVAGCLACERGDTVMTLRRGGHGGRNRVAFSGRAGSRVLRPGRYRAVIEATDAGGRRELIPAAVAFRVVRG